MRASHSCWLPSYESSKSGICNTAGPNPHNHIGPRATAARVRLSGLDNSLAAQGRLALYLKIWSFPRATKLLLPGHGLHTPDLNHFAVTALSQLTMHTAISLSSSLPLFITSDVIDRRKYAWPPNKIESSRTIISVVFVSPSDCDLTWSSISLQWKGSFFERSAVNWNQR